MHTPSTQYLLQVSFLLYNWEWRRKRTSQAKSPQHGLTEPLLSQECKTSLTGEKPEVSGQASFSRCLVMASGSAWKLGVPGKAAAHSSACAQYTQLIKPGAPWHSPPGSSELFNTEKESPRPGRGWEGGKLPYCWLPETHLKAYKELITPWGTQLQHHLKVRDIFG